MLDRISPYTIITGHLNTLKDFHPIKSLDKEYYSKQRYSRIDIVGFFILPLVVAIGLTFKQIHLTSPVINSLLTVMSILGALLFSLLLLVFDTLKNAQGRRHILFLEHLGSNVSFAIFNTLCCLVFLILSVSLTPSDPKELAHLPLYTLIIYGLTYYLLIVFLLTFLMILRRFHALLERRATDISKHSKETG